VNPKQGLDTEIVITEGASRRMSACGAHARSAVGLAELPFRIPVEIEGEVELTPQ
jgi:hypothetical protein